MPSQGGNCLSSGVSRLRPLCIKWWIPNPNVRGQRMSEVNSLVRVVRNYLTKADGSTLAWKIPWTEEPGRLQSTGSRRVGHNWETSLSLFPFMHWRRKWQPTPVFLPGESQGQGSLAGCRLWGCRVRHDWSDLAVAAWHNELSSPQQTSKDHSA